MTDAVRPPALWRVALAFAIVPLIASAAMASVQPLYAGLPELLDRIGRTTVIYAIVGAYPAAIVLGLPAYFLLRRRLRLSLLNCIWVAAAVAALPWVAFGLFSNPDYAFSNGHITHVGGAKTLWGWIDLVWMGLWIGLFGGVAGAAFWFITGWHTPNSEAVEHGSAPT